MLDPGEQARRAASDAARRNREQAQRATEAHRHHHLDNIKRYTDSAFDATAHQYRRRRRERDMASRYASHITHGYNTVRQPTSRMSHSLVSVLRFFALCGLSLLVFLLAIQSGIVSLGDGGVIGHATAHVNVRSGPSTSTRVLGTLSPEDEVQIECWTPDRWDRLDGPYAGAFVFDDFVIRTETPQRC